MSHHHRRAQQRQQQQRTVVKMAAAFFVGTFRSSKDYYSTYALEKKGGVKKMVLGHRGRFAYQYISFSKSSNSCGERASLGG